MGVGTIIDAVNGAAAGRGEPLCRVPVHLVHRHRMPAAMKLQYNSLPCYGRHDFFHPNAVVLFLGKRKTLGRLVEFLFQNDRSGKGGKALPVRIGIGSERRPHDRRAQRDHNTFNRLFRFFTRGSMMNPT